MVVKDKDLNQGVGLIVECPFCIDIHYVLSDYKKCLIYLLFSFVTLM